LRKAGVKIDPSNRHPIGQLALRRPGINRTPLGIALDLTYDGYVSEKNRRYLRSLGIPLKRMGLGQSSQGAWAKRQQLRSSQQTARQYGLGLRY
jgi:hypothetical protein